MKLLQKLLTLSLIVMFVTLSPLSTNVSAQPIVSDTTSSDLTVDISPYASQLWYSFEDLYTNESVTSTSSFTTSSTGSVVLTLVQYPSANGGGTVKCTYSLVNSSGKSVQSKTVTGNYTNTNTDVTFTNIPAGTYR